MKIIKPSEKAICFDKLYIGNVFQWDNSYYMVINAGANALNTVNLGNGFAFYFEGNKKVIPVNCELVIK